MVSEPTVADATNRIYESLQADNADLDAHIATLKAALAREGLKEAVFDPARLAQNNRSGRKLMQAYFRQRGVTVKYSAS
ncbi:MULTISPECIES: hypothetical protein [Sinorhizobium]|jgi:predicted nucleic acid-binding Zn ribbon protein|uniref:Uncharacterized protein n=4 Tax=Sinorhizobium TaxID=28105 RepID=H0G789_RHIML|nr:MULTISPECIES: hypothetical protein [Sinorhizobium]PII38466.1 hypothetical protein T190_20420 [Sinorhizobium meliloti CCBAU 01290]PST24838.1 hypothetical protein C7U62_17045 [Mesorhizobium loti]TWA90936.1 hypothetical protein FB000_13312 [Ensifer sp. SEMIA 134]TWB27433.1 hypothetical protein FB001_13012 [Ensifer sp. SEMIA 135]AEG05020.1 hypothetical protein SinmeB_2116 [Sinorhizobium meliloti BL225C]